MNKPVVWMLQYDSGLVEFMDHKPPVKMSDLKVTPLYAARAEGVALDAKHAALWRDLVLLDPMDLVTIFGGAGSDKILLGKLEIWIERKRGSVPASDK